MSTAKRKRDGPETLREEKPGEALRDDREGTAGAGPSDGHGAQHGAARGASEGDQARPPPASNGGAAAAAAGGGGGAERPKACVHEVARNPNFVEQLDASVHGTIDNPQYTGPMAKHYPFTLDPFQATAVACLERRESVLVSAHTSAGKTAVAEYAIAMGFRDKQKVVYTSPLKALSNQKYRELSEHFTDVGLMTGDVTISPNAACLVMTTEILRSMLYRASQELKEVGWVVFDEIHYMENRERGVVWEESIIFLPQHIKMVFLSATMSNAKEFAEWICHLHRQPCHVVYTDYRPTPLQHFLFPYGGKGLYLVVDSQGQFLESNFNRAAMDLEAARPRPEGEAGGGGRGGRGQGRGERGGRGGDRGGGRGKKPQGEKSDIYKIIRTIMEKKFTPVIVFSFRRRECEALALSLAKLDFNSEEEKAMVGEVFGNALQLLAEEDRELPAVRHILPLLRRGIGVHHSGLLPILKELIEILFQEGLIKALFATETFAMGLNMPAKTVVFTATSKWDGEENRMLSSGDYIQMSGRAGRRGKDANGIVIVMADETVTLESCRGMMLGKPSPLESSFRLTYYALLNLMARAEGQFTTEYVIAHSFHQFQHDRQVPEIERRISGLEAEASKLDADGQLDEAVKEYHALRLSLAQLSRKLRDHVMRPDRCLPFLLPGRLIRVQDGPDDWGWGVAITALKRPTAAVSNTPGSAPAPGPAGAAPSSAASYIVDTLLLCAPAKRGEGEADTGGKGPKLRPCGLEDPEGEMQVIPVQLPAVAGMSLLRIALPRDLRPPEARKSVHITLKELHKRFQDGVPLLDPIKDMGIDDPGLTDLIRQVEAEEEKLQKSRLFQASEDAQSLGLLKRKSEIQAEIQRLKLQTKESQLSQFKAELHNRSRVLRRLGHIDAEGIVQFKGRAACLITTGDELLVTELMFDGAFNELDPSQVVAVCSCFMPSEKTSEAPSLPEPLKGPFRVLQEKAQWVATVQAEEKIDIDDEDYVESFKPSLMEVFYQWTKGASFSDVCELTDIFEGTIVRVARRLDELLNEMKNASHAVGDTSLEEKFEESSKLLRRGIMFANSLYLE